MILTCDRRYYTFDLKNNNKALNWRSHFKNLKKFQNIYFFILKVVKITKILFQKTFFITTISKTFDFLGQKSKKKLSCFSRIFIWNHPPMTYSLSHFILDSWLMTLDSWLFPFRHEEVSPSSVFICMTRWFQLSKKVV